MPMKPRRRSARCRCAIWEVPPTRASRADSTRAGRASARRSTRPWASRSRGRKWFREIPSDFLARSWGNWDWAHPSHSGVRKEVDQLMAFFKTDPTVTPWFLRKTDQPPALSASGSTLAGQAPLKVTFSADASSPSGIRDLAWSFGDGCYALAPAPTKTFHVPGTYDVRVTATDRAGNAATRSLAVKVDGASSPPRKGKRYPAA